MRTVLGDVPADTLGALDYHEHLFQVSPLLPGDDLDDEDRSGAEAASLAHAGIDAMVEATPTGLGRRPEAVARIARATGLRIVHTTGAHHGGHYGEEHPLRLLDEDGLRRRFTADVLTGFGPDLGGTTSRGSEPPPGAVESTTVPSEPTSVRAGLVKAGIRYWAIGPFERRMLTAVAATARATGAAVMVHLDHGSAAHEVLDLLASDGLAADRVVLAHVDRNLDAGLHASLAERGAFLGYDGMARHREAPDAAILDCLTAVVSADHGDRVLLGGDVARATRYRAYGGLPGLDYLPVRFVPRMIDRIGADAVRTILEMNGARLLALAAETVPVPATAGA